MPILTYQFLIIELFNIVCQRKEGRMKKMEERKLYQKLYEAMEAIVHICRDGCWTIGPHNKVLKANEAPCNFPACKGLELLVRHFAGCKNRVSGGCTHCKRMWQILKLHSRICAESNLCKVPLCRYNPLAFVLFHSVVFYCVISSHTTKL